MSADASSTTQKIDTSSAPPLKPLVIPNKLAPTPDRPPQYAVKVKNSQGEEVILGDPAITRALIALMNTHAVHGGAACHWGGPAAFAEIMSAVHGLMFETKGRSWHEAFNFVNDAGHTENGVYALRANYGFDDMTFEDLKGFRSIESKLTGHGESHLNPQGVFLSNGPLGSGFPQSQGLALADKLAKNDRVTICTLSDGASMEGEAKEAFAAIPGLAARGLLNPYLLVISDNDTKLSGRITKDAFSMQPTFESLEVLGWNVMKVRNGHDLQAVYLALEKALEEAQKNPNKPVCVWAKTVKGYGVKATEQSSSGGHGFPLKNGEKIVEFVEEICNGAPPEDILEWAKSLRADWEKREEAKKSKPSVPAVKKIKIQEGIAQAMIEAAKNGYPVFSVSADLQGSTGVSAFQKAFPDRFIEVGVAEANMISAGAGLAKMGFIPVVDTFAQFGVTKGNLPLTMASLSQAPVIAIFSHTGFQDAADGASHQATTYISAVSGIPHTEVIACSCAEEARALTYMAIERYAEVRKKGNDGETYIIFIGRENFPERYVEKAQYQWRKPQILARGKDMAIVTCGSLVPQAIKAQKMLKDQGIEATLIENPFINHPDVKEIGEAIKASGGKLVTVEDHQVLGGMGAILTHELLQAGYNFKLRSLGIKGRFGQSAYIADHLYTARGLDAEAIISASKSIL